MKNRKETLFAIYKNGVHMGNTRAASEEDAIYIYLIDSGYSKEDLVDEKLRVSYTTAYAKKGLHFVSSLISD